jgi:ABC-type Fe3+/spermidine/putrescine transport system ATPase subunit
MPGLEVKGVEQRFGEFVALHDVSLSIAPGEFVTLLGPSGCGKTTLLNIIAGFLQPSRGQILIGGEDVTGQRPEYRDTAMCFQSYALFPHLSVRDNIAFGPRQKRLARAETQRRVTSLLVQMGLDLHADKLPNALSGGQQQRVALARALAVEPGLVLFDEPLSNLDAKLRDQVRTEIRSLQRARGFTAVYVTHDQAEALAMSDRVFLLNAGRVEQSGKPRDIYFKPQTRFVADFIGAANLHQGRVAGGAMQTPFGAIPVDAPDGGDVTLCWRPESVTLGGPLQGCVTTAAFQGGHMDVFLSAGDATVRLQISGDRDFGVGDTVSFDIARDRVVVLNDPLDGSDHA